MTKVLAILAALSSPVAAEVSPQLQNVAADSFVAAQANSPEGLSAGGALAFGEKTGAAPVDAGLRGQFAAAQRQPAVTTAGPSKNTLTTGGVPEPSFGKKVGDTFKEYTPHLLTAGVGGAAGAVAAKVAGFGLLGGIAAGAGIGLAAMYLYKKGETGAAIGAAGVGLAGLALGGPIGGLAGAGVGGLGAWMLGKFFS
jgi:hypothetical protein